MRGQLLWLVLGAGAITGGCGDEPRQPPAAAATDPSAPAFEEPEFPERDVSGIDVCAAVPAEALAAALEMTVAEPARALENDPAPSCSYRLSGSAPYARRIDLSLKDLFDYDWALRTAKDFDREIIDIADIGASAYMKKTIDGQWDLWARRSDGLVVNAMAGEQSHAIAAARIAIERTP